MISLCKEKQTDKHTDLTHQLGADKVDLLMSSSATWWSSSRPCRCISDHSCRLSVPINITLRSPYRTDKHIFHKSIYLLYETDFVKNWAQNFQWKS